MKIFQLFYITFFWSILSIYSYIYAMEEYLHSLEKSIEIAQLCDTFPEEIQAKLIALLTRIPETQTFYKKIQPSQSIKKENYKKLFPKSAESLDNNTNRFLKEELPLGHELKFHVLSPDKKNLVVHNVPTDKSKINEIITVYQKNESKYPQWIKKTNFTCKKPIINIAFKKGINSRFHSVILGHENNQVTVFRELDLFNYYYYNTNKVPPLIHALNTHLELENPEVLKNITQKICYTLCPFTQKLYFSISNAQKWLAILQKLFPNEKRLEKFETLIKEKQLLLLRKKLNKSYAQINAISHKVYTHNQSQDDTNYFKSTSLSEAEKIQQPYIKNILKRAYQKMQENSLPLNSSQLRGNQKKQNTARNGGIIGYIRSLLWQCNIDTFFDRILRYTTPFPTNHYT